MLLKLHSYDTFRARLALRLLPSDAVNGFPSTFLYCDCESDFSSDDARNPVPVPGTCTASAASGRVKWKVEPRPLFAVAHKRPPCDSIMERLIGRPIPDPCALVVKKALKISSTFPAGSPTPVSLTEISTVPSF